MYHPFSLSAITILLENPEKRLTHNKEKAEDYFRIYKSGRLEVLYQVLQRSFKVFYNRRLWLLRLKVDDKSTYAALK